MTIDRPWRSLPPRGALLFLLALPACGGAAPEAPAPAVTVETAAGTITAEDMARRITVLAHDTMAGRDTPSPELEEAAEYIARELRAAGMEPAGEDGTFIHRYDYTVAQLDADRTTVRVSGSGWQPTYAVDYFMVPTAEPQEAPAYYVGVAGEAGPPPPEARGRILVYRHTGTELNQEWQQRLVSALQPALMLGAPGVILVLDPEFPVGMIPELARMTAEQAGPTPVVGITHEAGAELVAGLGAELGDLDGPTALGTQPLVVRSTATESTHRPPNVVAMLPGSDSVLRDTYVVLTAHFDHVGVGTPDETGDSIFNGADDDASGTAAVLEIAEALAALDEPPARSVVFLLVSGEEKGLLGSRAWVEDPTLDIGSVVANVNLDMMGRDPLPDTVIGIGQEYSTLEETLRELMAAHPELELTLILDPAPEERYFLRSDQLPFVQQRIPAVFFTTGEHEDYHQVSDEPEAIHADKAARVTRLAFYLAHAIASDPTPPEYTDEGWARIQEMLTASPF